MGPALHRHCSVSPSESVRWGRGSFSSPPHDDLAALTHHGVPVGPGPTRRRGRSTASSTRGVGSGTRQGAMISFLPTCSPGRLWLWALGRRSGGGPWPTACSSALNGHASTPIFRRADRRTGSTPMARGDKLTPARSTPQPSSPRAVRAVCQRAGYRCRSLPTGRRARRLHPGNLLSHDRQLPHGRHRHGTPPALRRETAGSRTRAPLPVLYGLF
jgi:hypothetical protein